MALRLDGLSVTNPKGLKAGESESESFSSAVALATTGDLLLLQMLVHDKQVLGLVETGHEGGWLRSGGESRGAQARAIFLFFIFYCSGCGSSSAHKLVTLEVKEEDQRFLTTLKSALVDGKPTRSNEPRADQHFVTW